MAVKHSASKTRVAPFDEAVALLDANGGNLTELVASDPVRMEALAKSIIAAPSWQRWSAALDAAVAAGNKAKAREIFSSLQSQWS